MAAAFDIHAHILPLVDDGAYSEQQSLNMVREAAVQGVTDIVLTPHYRGGYKKTGKELISAFEDFKNTVKNADIPVNLYLGQEIYIGEDFKSLFLEEKILTLNGTEYVLIEFDFGYERDIAETVYELKQIGYIPVIAHFERYSYADIETALEIKELGGLIQINADSLVGKRKRKYKKLISELFVNELVDFVASDVHHNRPFLMKKARGYVSKRYGEAVAKKIFSENAEKIIKGRI